MTIRFTAILDLHGFPESDGDRIVAATEVAIRQALQPFKSPLQSDSVTVHCAPARKPPAIETGYDPAVPEARLA